MAIGSVPSSSGRVLTRRGASTQKRLVKAAWEVFGEKPYGEARISEITARAGVSTGSFYSYFASKEELFRVIAREALDEMVTVQRRDPDNVEGNPVRDIAYASRQFFLACIRHRLIAQSIESLHIQDEEVHQARHSALLRKAQLIERWIHRLQDDGICDPDIDAWLTGVALQSMNATIAYDQLVHRSGLEEDVEKKVEALVATVTPIWARAVGLDAWL